MISLIVTWPDNLDYPLFRKFLLDHPELNPVVAITPKYMELNFTDFILKHVSGSFVVEPGAGDWRDVAMKQALKRATTEWIWFLEQDFFFKDVDAFINLLSAGRDAYGIVQGNRLHPCSLMVKRDVLLKTSLDFAAKPPEYDHFGHVTQDIMRNYEWGQLAEFGLIEGRDWYHHAGLSQNYNLVQEGQEPNYNRENFLVYNRSTITPTVPQDPRYLALAQQAEEMIAPLARFI